MVEGLDGAVRLTWGVNLDYPAGPPDTMEIAGGRRVARRAAARLVVHRSVRRADVEPAALRRRRGHDAGRRRSTTRSRRWRWSRPATSRARAAARRCLTGDTRMTHPPDDRRHQHFWRYQHRQPAVRLDRRVDGGAAARLPARATAMRGNDGRGRRRHPSPSRRGRRPRKRAWLLELADRHPFIAGVVGWVDLAVRRRRQRSSSASPGIRASSASATSSRASRTASSSGPRSAAASPPRRLRARLRHPGLSRASCPRRSRFARAVPAAALRARSPGQAGHPRRRVRSEWRRHFARACRASQRLLQAVGAGDGSGLGNRGRRRSCVRTSTPRSTRSARRG